MRSINEKEELAKLIITTDLIKKGYTPFVSTASNQLPFDIIAYKDQKYHTIHARYFIDNLISPKTESRGFDYYGLYLPNLNIVIYPAYKFTGIKIYSNNNNEDEYFWYEDFLNFTNEAAKRNNIRRSIGISGYSGDATLESPNIPKRINNRKVERPNRGVLIGQIRALGYTGTGRIYGVSDNAIRKWEEAYKEREK
jgi:hypothetical protein